MIAKVLLLCAAVAAVQSTWIGSGIASPGLITTKHVIAPAAVKTSVVTIPVAVTTEKRVIGTIGSKLLAPAPVVPAIMAPGVIGHGLIGNGLLGAVYGSPIGFVSPFGYKGAGIIAAPAIAKAIW